MHLAPHDEVLEILDLRLRQISARFAKGGGCSLKHGLDRGGVSQVGADGDGLSPVGNDVVDNLECASLFIAEVHNHLGAGLGLDDDDPHRLRLEAVESGRDRIHHAMAQRVALGAIGQRDGAGMTCSRRCAEGDAGRRELQHRSANAPAAQSEEEIPPGHIGSKEHAARNGNAVEARSVPGPGLANVDITPEFALTGTGLGTVRLDPTQLRLLPA